MEYDHEYAVSNVTSTLSEYPESVSAIGAKVMNALESGSHLVEKLLGAFSWATICKIFCAIGRFLPVYLHIFACQ